jgi:hypothetical protein
MITTIAMPTIAQITGGSQSGIAFIAGKRRVAV